MQFYLGGQPGRNDANKFLFRSFSSAVMLTSPERVLEWFVIYDLQLGSSIVAITAMVWWKEDGIDNALL
jgi:hypothetical protein